MHHITSTARTFLLLSIVALCASSAAAQPAGARERARELARAAVEQTDAGQYERARALLDSAIALDPSESSYRYEKAYAYYLGGDYTHSISILGPLLADTSATELYFDLAADAYQAMGDTATVRATLARGVERLAHAGSLFARLGTIEATAGRYQEAVALYERGMHAAPMYPENYYRAALILMSSSEPIWGLVYGEIFMNLERESQRTHQIGALLLETYRSAIHAGGDSTFSVRFSESTSALQVSGSSDPNVMVDAMARPEWLYEMTALQALSVSDHCRKQGVTIDCLSQLRTEFVRRWFNQKLDERMPSPLFDWQRTLLDVGYLEEYNYWLLGAGDPDEFYAWVERDPQRFELFQKWFRVNGMSFEPRTAPAK
jgi:tetratricopeptide (TPR) repeat protein